MSAKLTLSFPDCSSEDKVLSLPGGLFLPATILIKQRSSAELAPAVSIVLGHGLGFNPQKMHHRKDGWLSLVAQSSLESNTAEVTAILYTARGHGESSGWEESAPNAENFSWKSLSHDMATVASAEGKDSFIACGNSMGAGTALFAAIHYPERVRGLILVRPPTGWEERRARRDEIVEGARKLEEANAAKKNGSLHHHVLFGATAADLPALDDNESYGKISCPVLILAVRGDNAHPEVSATNIAERIASAELHFVDSIEEANVQWPKLIQEFIAKIATTL